MSRSRIPEMATHLGAVVASAQALRERQGSTLIAGGSKAEREMIEYGSDGRATTPLTEAYTQGVKALFAAEDFCLSAVEMAGRADRSFTTMSAFRGAAEASAQASWYLDPEIDSHERAARAMGGLMQAVGAAKRFGRKAKIEFEPKPKAEIHALDEIVKRYPGVPRKLPNLEQLLRQAGKSLGLENKVSEAGLESLSNVSHSMKDARDQIIQGWEDLASPELEPHQATEWGYWYITNIFAAATSQCANLLGWETRTWIDEAAQETSEIQELFNAERAERIRNL